MKLIKVHTILGMWVVIQIREEAIYLLHLEYMYMT